MSDHISWSDVDFGAKSKYMRRTMKALRWLASGAQLAFPSRTIALTTTEHGGPYFVVKGTVHDLSLTANERESKAIALGLDPDLNILFSMVKETTDDAWEALETEAEKHGY